MVFIHDLISQSSQAISIGLASLLTGLAVHLFHGIAKWRKKRGTKLRNFILDMEGDQQIRSLLDEARNKLGAGDAYIGAIHNGGELMSGASMRRITRMYERPFGLVGQAEQFVGDLISALPGEMELVAAHGASFTPIDKLPVGKLRWVLESGARKAISRSVIIPHDRPLGYVGFDFTTAEPPANLDEVAGGVAYQIGQILMRY